MSEKIKKGNMSWKPAGVLEFTDKDPNYRYRVVRKDDNNLAKKLKEQWEFVSETNDPRVKHNTPTGRPDLGTAMTSVTEGYDWVLMKIPEEVAQERDQYINAKTALTETGLTAQTRRDLGSGVPSHGKITKERHGIKTVIE